MIARWEARRALLYGSEHAGWFESQDGAVDYARKDIAKHGGEGRIELNDADNRIIYYTNFAELT